MVICPFTPYGVTHDLITCQIWHQWGPDFVEYISPKPLGIITPFKVLLNCVDLKLCYAIVICPFAPYGLAHGPKTCQIRYHWGADFAEYISLKQLDGLHFWGSMELSKPVVVHYHGLMTLTLGFQDQMLKKLYHRNRRAEWHKTKGI